jgi:hypothetical protein
VETAAEPLAGLTFHMWVVPISYLGPNNWFNQGAISWRLYVHQESKHIEKMYLIHQICCIRIVPFIVRLEFLSSMVMTFLSSGILYTFRRNTSPPSCDWIKYHTRKHNKECNNERRLFNCGVTACMIGSSHDLLCGNNSLDHDMIVWRDSVHVVMWRTFTFCLVSFLTEEGLKRNSPVHCVFTSLDLPV